MKRGLITVTAALAAGAALGRLGDVMTSYPAPANNPIALALQREDVPYLYVYCQTSPYRIYKMDARNGSLYSSFISPQGTYTRGLAYSQGGSGGLPTGNYLWMGNYATGHIYRCNLENGTVYASFPANHDMSGGLAVMARDRGYQPTFMLSNDTSPRYVFRQSLTSGSIYSSFAPAQPLYDLAWEWPNLLVWGGNTGNGVYAYDIATGRFIESFTMPANNVIGLAYFSQYLCVATTTGSHRIWIIHCPDWRWPAVHPVSLGCVKALFR